MDSQTYKKALIRLEESVSKLSDLGWTIPPYLTPREAQELLKLGSIQELDSFFIEFYSGNQDIEFKKLAADLLNNSHLEKWKPLVSECLDAYKDKNYLVTIPSLLSILEGSITLAIGSSGTLLIKLCNCEYLRCDEGSVKRVVWKSIHRFVSNIYRTNNFNEGRLELINRHWILHGRDVLSWSQADSLRLFQALHTIGLVTKVREDNLLYSELEEDSNIT